MRRLMHESVICFPHANLNRPIREAPVYARFARREMRRLIRTASARACRFPAEAWNQPM